MLKKITWLIVIRLFLVTLFLSIGALVFKIDRLFFYFLIAGVYLLSIIYLIWLLNKKVLKLLLIIQLLIDCILVSIIVLYTGSIDSVFTILYMVVILNASVIVSPLIGMITMAIACLLYVGQLSVGFYNLVPFIDVRPWTQNTYMVLYIAHVHVITFLLVGILSTALSKKIHQMEEKIKEKERFSLMGELAAQIAHEIRNPLTTISGSIELLEEELKTTIDAKNLNVMKAIVAESERMSNIFEQFLDFSKLDRLTFTSVSVQELLDEIVILLNNTQSLRNVTVQTSYDITEGVFEADRNRIKQVFWNIIRNALEAMLQGGCLSIRAYEDRERVYIEFRDSGAGMTKREIKRLFVPLQSTKRGGTGIGLAIAHKIIEKHHGDIIIHSNKNKGSTFLVSIPKVRMSE
ncbi:MAG: GHKL domain-containing protein [Candidatus Omnitrophica bacterium]|nr:GHKL domain-containing protein [Candidatus Omnitrophota bacterium]